jgi:hypothetical protein
LGEFSPLGRVFTSGSFFLITQVDQLFGLICVFVLTKKRGWAICSQTQKNFWAIISQTQKNGLGDYFANSSGHPGRMRTGGGEQETNCGELINTDNESCVFSEVVLPMGNIYQGKRDAEMEIPAQVGVIFENGVNFMNQFRPKIFDFKNKILCKN